MKTTYPTKTTFKKYVFKRGTIQNPIKIKDFHDFKIKFVKGKIERGQYIYFLQINKAT
jgi:hypothetical protein